ncbi:MAG: hypothetical protein ACE5KG_00525, partial [Nitrososphaerales archaeon]
MPEIWLPYGNVEVPLDIRSENLGELIENNSPTIDHDQLLAKIKDLSLDQEVQLILPEISTNILSLLQVILEMHADSRKIEILCKREDRDPIKRAIDPKEYPINPLGSGVLDLAKNTKDGSKILLSEVGFNPVFGFSGGPLSLAMEVDGREKFVEAYNKEVPSPGDETVVETWEREIIPLEG